MYPKRDPPQNGSLPLNSLEHSPYGTVKPTSVDLASGDGRSCLEGRSLGHVICSQSKRFGEEDDQNGRCFKEPELVLSRIKCIPGDG